MVFFSRSSCLGLGILLRRRRVGGQLEEREARKMCVAAWVWQAHPLHPFLLLFNRDELYDRPTEALDWWGNGRQKILGGRDGVTGGTWLGCSGNGRIAFLTNVREISLPAAKSRGDLPVQFLESDASPVEFAEKLAKKAHEYKGFNLVMADLRSNLMVYSTNRSPVPFRILSPGLHALSNATLDSPWPKSLKLVKGLQETLETNGAKEILHQQFVERLMRDTTKADRSLIPETDYGFDVEFEVSSIFIDAKLDVGHYCTRSTSVVRVSADMEVSFYEEHLEGELWKGRYVQYLIEDIDE